MIRQGHKWEDIKHYHLGEVGVFIRAAASAKKSELEESLWLTWSANNADHDGMKKLLKQIAGKSSENPEEVQNNWKELKGIIGG